MTTQTLRQSATRTLAAALASALRAPFARLRDYLMEDVLVESATTTSLTAADWADLPVHHPRRDA